MRSLLLKRITSKELPSESVEKPRVSSDVANPSEILNMRTVSGIKKALLHKPGVAAKRMPLSRMACLMRLISSRKICIKRMTIKSPRLTQRGTLS